MLSSIFELKSAWVAVFVFSMTINLLMLAPTVYMMQVSDRVMTSRDNRAIRESNERQTVALYGTFRDLNGQTVAGMTTLGTAGINGVRDTATAGFGALERTAAAAFKNPTYNINVNGNDNNLFGSASTRTYTNNCTSGQAGSSSGTTGSPAGGPSGQAPCTISK